MALKREARGLRMTSSLWGERRRTADWGRTVTVVVAGGLYPEQNNAGSPIGGVERAERLGAHVFHAGTALRGDRLVTNGGRILGVTGVAEDLEGARAVAYAGASEISFAGARYRTDIALPEASHVA